MILEYACSFAHQRVPSLLKALRLMTIKYIHDTTKELNLQQGSRLNILFYGD